MKAQMKLVTGMVPIAMGVALALMSGMVRSEGKAQPALANVVSAETTLPSVGHRPHNVPGKWRLARYIATGGSYGTSSFKHARPGFAITISGEHIKPENDKDNTFFGEDQTLPLNTSQYYSTNTNGFSCDIYRDDILISHRKHCVDNRRHREPYVFEQADAGHTIRIDYWTYTGNTIDAGYQSTPSKSIVQSYSIPVKADFSIENSSLEVVENVSMTHSQGIKTIVHAVDKDGELMDDAVIYFELRSDFGKLVAKSHGADIIFPYGEYFSFSSNPAIQPGNYVVKAFYSDNKNHVLTANVTVMP